MKAWGELLRSRRELQGMTVEDMARLLGYRDVKKGMRRVLTVEATGVVREDLLLKMAEVLGLDWADLEEVLFALSSSPSSMS
jgi:transcriptional regulator with XRE-family HTH domain